MTLISRFKRTKKAIEENKAKVTAEEEEEKKNEEAAVKAPYKHVPSHASVDALFGAPSTWKHEDRPKILEHNKRRSQRTVSRTHSTLSTNSPGNATPNDTPTTTRAASYDGYNPTWNSRIEQVTFFDELNRPLPLPPIKTQVPNAPDSAVGISPSSTATQTTSQIPSPVNSKAPSSASSSSDIGLEITAKIPRRPLLSDAFKHQPVIFQNHDILQRLHTSTTRKLGEAPNIQAPIVEVPVPEPAVVAPVAQTKPVVVAVAPVAKSRWSRMGKKKEESTKE
ncbi:uncharacterized protein EAF01_000422 [Botrytis porri]|uniref:Uncharacterized protein n=1 Tax=Botrytis porri TaxID=87229 RepID=A0A4Z1K5G5_9HELO|nr:uncharacterized protein EAF01_000422 [Botrytis porri]KAF7914016.1 hypothetical protein EAF01_000422 [Botrytis porri]TGO80888.1 hypothetical protein BPOR_1571g00010 [Botrytis porri]